MMPKFKKEIAVKLHYVNYKKAYNIHNYKSAVAIVLRFLILKKGVAALNL